MRCLEVNQQFLSTIVAHAGSFTGRLARAQSHTPTRMHTLAHTSAHARAHTHIHTQSACLAHTHTLLSAQPHAHSSHADTRAHGPAHMVLLICEHNDHTHEARGARRAANASTRRRPTASAPYPTLHTLTPYTRYTAGSQLLQGTTTDFKFISGEGLDMDKIRCTLRQFVRDWSDEGWRLKLLKLLKHHKPRTVCQLGLVPTRGFRPGRGTHAWAAGRVAEPTRGFRAGHGTHAPAERGFGAILGTHALLEFHFSVLGTHSFLEFHFPGLCWHTVLGFWCSRSFKPRCHYFVRFGGKGMLSYLNCRCGRAETKLQAHHGSP